MKIKHELSGHYRLIDAPPGTELLKVCFRWDVSPAQPSSCSDLFEPKFLRPVLDIVIKHANGSSEMVEDVEHIRDMFSPRASVEASSTPPVRMRTRGSPKRRHP